LGGRSSLDSASDHKLPEIAEFAGREAVREMLLLLGIDASTPERIATVELVAQPLKEGLRYRPKPRTLFNGTGVGSVRKQE
jgi:hypothetical protein